MIYWISWSVISGLLLVFTLIRPHPYRFSRYLAFESVLSLAFLNARVWFHNPLSLIQVISWALLMGSLYLVIHGFYLIKTRGNPQGDFEDTTSLITTGPYRFIRHPLYGSLILFSLGTFLKKPELIGFFLVCFTCLGSYLAARIEERYNLERFGEAYQVYMDRSKMFIPYIF